MGSDATMLAANLAAQVEWLGGHSDSHRTMVWIAVAAVFVNLVIGLLVTYRRVQKQVELEQAERIIEAEFSGIDEM